MLLCKGSAQLKEIKGFMANASFICTSGGHWGLLEDIGASKIRQASQSPHFLNRPQPYQLPSDSLCMPFSPSPYLSLSVMLVGTNSGDRSASAGTK